MLRSQRFGLALIGLLVSGAAFAAPPADPPAPPKAGSVPAARSGLQAAPVPNRSGDQIHLWAPVAPPYSGSAYRDFGGQPETGADALAVPNARPH